MMGVRGGLNLDGDQTQVVQIDMADIANPLWGERSKDHSGDRETEGDQLRRQNRIETVQSAPPGERIAECDECPRAYP